MIEKKVWGEVEHLFANRRAALSTLSVNDHFCCSIHRHTERANLFWVQSGMLIVEEFSKPVDVSRRIYLRAGGVHIVPSGRWHRFRVVQSGQVIELYWPDSGGDVSIHDIERYDEGGPDSLEDLEI